MSPQYELILATDLDGTFLEGDDAVKHFFYHELLRLRDHVMLIYTTGRSVETVKYFCQNEYLPYPHYIIGDHGSHVVDGINFNPVEHLQNPIIKKWNNSNHFIKELLCNDAGIELQPLNPPYRVAYYYNPQYFQNQTVEKITNAGFDVILSCNRYFDILPRHVNKGSTLLALLDYLNLNHETVITSGDSLNDLSLFQTGLKSIAVGNSEPNLISTIQNLNLNNVYHSHFPGILGIIDGLHFYVKHEMFDFDSAA